MGMPRPELDIDLKAGDPSHQGWGFQSDNSTDILFTHPLDVTWIHYNKLHAADYTRVHYDSTSDVMVMRVESKVNTFTRVNQLKWCMDKLDLANAVQEE